MEKLFQCLNCELDLPNEEIFCPNCGQKNHATRLKIRTFFNELVNSVFNIDGRIWLTIKAAFFNVGTLAKEFNQGKRKKYVPPVRFYLFASLIYFLILGMLAKVNSIENDISFQETLEKRDSSINIRINIFYLDFNLKIEELLAIPSYSNQQMNNLLVEQGHLPTFYNRFALKNMVIRAKDGMSKMRQQLASIASGGMFLLLPVLAWLFYLFFSKTYPFYVEHLVFIIYIQSTAFLISAFKNIFQIFDFKDWLNHISWLVIGVYIIVGVRQFYSKGWLKTIGYFLPLFLLYGIILATFMVVITFIVLLFF